MTNSLTINMKYYCNNNKHNITFHEIEMNFHVDGITVNQQLIMGEILLIII